MGDVEEKLNEGEAEASSECSSGCESGWTMYFNHTNDDGLIEDGRKYGLEQVEEAEDLSMISDASSGPPHFRGHDEFFSPSALVKKDGIRKIVDMQYHRKQLCSPLEEEESYGFLDDTASSPMAPVQQKFNIITTTNNQQPLLPVDDIVELSHGFSATHFKVHAYNIFKLQTSSVCQSVLCSCS